MPQALDERELGAVFIGMSFVSILLLSALDRVCPVYLSLRCPPMSCFAKGRHKQTGSPFIICVCKCLKTAGFDCTVPYITALFRAFAPLTAGDWNPGQNPTLSDKILLNPVLTEIGEIQFFPLFCKP